MDTISDLRKILGLQTANQVRNRIEAIKDVLSDHLRRGPNNQILVNEAGTRLLRQLQDLHDSGLTIKEASDVLRANSVFIDTNQFPVSSTLSQKRADQGQRGELVTALKAEIAFLRDRVAYLESRAFEKTEPSDTSQWWEGLREDADVS
ncbi:MAG: hypothetical protein U9Q23_02575 [Candidatus Bipolaricaulota bacterium]|nr:hypothetical protein [Candidatus Bipolaricaulota bacterium]